MFGLLPSVTRFKSPSFITGGMLTTYAAVAKPRCQAESLVSQRETAESGESRTSTRVEGARKRTVNPPASMIEASNGLTKNPTQVARRSEQAYIQMWRARGRRDCADRELPAPLQATHQCSKNEPHASCNQHRPELPQTTHQTDLQQRTTQFKTC